MKFYVARVFCVLAGCVLACPSLPGPGRADAQAPRRQVSVAVAKQDRVPVAQTVHPLFGPWFESLHAPGAIVVVRCDGETRYFPFGEANIVRHRPVTPDTLFALASVTKVFTTTSLAMEVDAGRMQLTDPVADYAPYLARNGRDIRAVTLEQLATHTSSLQRVPTVHRPDNQWNKRLLMEWAAQWRAPYRPGTRYLYSNVALGLLGYAIENREEKPLIDVWREQFLGPLQMNHTTFAISPADERLLAQGYGENGEPVEHNPIGGWPAGGRLSSSGRDMGVFLTANLGERTDLPALTRAMQLAQQPRFQISDQLTLGLAWQRQQIRDELVIDKNGGLPGTSTYIGMLPERHIGVVVMVNRSKSGATGIGRKILLALAGKQHTESESDEQE